MSKQRSEAVLEAETRRKLEIAQEFLGHAMTERLRLRTWGVITVEITVERGHAREVRLADQTTVRDLPEEKIETLGLPALTK